MQDDKETLKAMHCTYTNSILLLRVASIQRKPSEAVYKSQNETYMWMAAQTSTTSAPDQLQNIAQLKLMYRQVILFQSDECQNEAPKLWLHSQSCAELYLQSSWPVLDTSVRHGAKPMIDRDQTFVASIS